VPPPGTVASDICWHPQTLYACGMAVNSFREI
jgi:hypothetical protein